ncbi:TonB-dependent receptor [Blastomonas sp. AAP53]|uniref:TonB-dependent receptor plug domain-containing protein n=1 Tax=Blastomonas sp. AAP53 TaxID=1248760 RepID=UPI00031ECC60|nr:TonB-dependent receptor [Blastomonas sp. AAP53]
MNMNGSISRAAMVVALLASSHTAWAASAADDVGADVQAAEAQDDETPERADIVVTGTRRTDRTVIESSVPIDVFTSDDLKTQPSPQLQTILQTLVPSFNQQRNLLGDASAFVRPPTLRGLPPDQILVLINGKRMHRSALVQVAGGQLAQGSQGPDLSQIPGQALGRIEVLRDGASALYGSDAIAGVINLGLSTKDSGLDMQVRYGQTYQGDGQDTQVSAIWGSKLGSDGGYFNVTGEFIDQNVFDRSSPRPEIAPLVAAGITPDIPNGNRLGQPENRAYRLVWNASLPLGDKDELYLFGNWGTQRQGNDFNYRRPIGVTATPITGRGPGFGNTGALGKSINTTYLDRLPNGNFSETGRTFEASEIFPNGFTPFFEAENEDFSIVGGYKGETNGGLRYDLSAASGTNKIRYFMSNTLNPSMGPDSPTSFYLGKLVQTETNLNLDLSYPVELGLASTLNIAGGVEFRRESYEVGLGDRASWLTGPFAAQTVQRANGTTFLSTKPVGANGFPGFGPDSVTSGGRNSISAYLDLEADVLESVTLSGALRYDRFTDFGDTVNGKISARWAASDAIAVRGNFNTGFRAPTPGQQFTQNVQTAFPNGSPVPVAVATVRPDSIVGIAYGSSALTPEKSTSFSGGLVLTPGGGFTFTLDYYNIKVKDRIGITGNFNVTAANRTALLGLGVANALDLGQINFFTNGFATRTQGVDAVLTHRATTGMGSFNTSLAVNWNKSKVTDIRSVTPSAAIGGTARPLIDRVREGNIEESLPRWRAVLSETFTSGMFDVTARVNYASSFTTYFAPATGFDPAFASLYPNPWPKTFSAEVWGDLEIGVTFEEKYRIAVGGQNIFDNYPERETRNIYPQTGGAANGSFYPDTSPLGWAGGFWYVRGSVSF